MLKNRFLGLLPQPFMAQDDDMGGDYDDYDEDSGDDSEDTDDVDSDEEQEDNEEDKENEDDGSEEDEEPESDKDDDSKSDEEDSKKSDEDAKKDYVHKDEVSKIVQRRVNSLQKKLEVSEESMKIVNTISNITGIPVESLAGQLTEAAVRMVAQRDKITEAQARTQINTLINDADQKKAKRQLDLDKEEIRILREPKKFPAYDEYAEEIREVALDKGLKLSEAYVLITADRRRVMENYKKETPEKKKAKSINKKIGSSSKPTKPSKSTQIELDRRILGDLDSDDILMYSDANSAYDKVIAKRAKKKK